MAQRVREQRISQKLKQRAEDLKSTAEISSAPDVQEVKDELDALLDSIDAVLEENAEEFVKGYIQKGGE